MEKYLSECAKRLNGQPMFKLLERIKQMNDENMIHFEIGDPDFNTPKSIKHACIDAINENNTHYTMSRGTLELREAICKFTKNEYILSHFSPSPDQVVVAPGCNPLIYAVIRCLVDNDEEVLLPDPSFPTYESVLNFLGLMYKRIPMLEMNNFNITVDDIRKVWTPKTKLLILNSPNNPTGSVMTQKNIIEIVSFAVNHNMFILSDEIYNLLVYDLNTFYSPSFFDRCKKRTIVINGFSKCLAMSGWRLGYMIGPEWLSEKVALLMQTTVSCTNTFVQKACTHAYNHFPYAELNTMKKTLAHRRDILVSGLNSIKGISCIKPKGAFYVFPNISETGLSSELFVELMFRHRVAMLPGTDFGEFGKGYVRMAYTTSAGDIISAVERIRKALQ